MRIVKKVFRNVIGTLLRIPILKRMVLKLNQDLTILLNINRVSGDRIDEVYNEKTEYLRKAKKNSISPYEISFFKKIRHIQAKIDRIETNSVVAIYGIGEHTDFLLKLINLPKIEFIITDQKVKEYNGYLCVAPTSENLSKVDVIIISSFVGQDKIGNFIEDNINWKGTLIRLYDTEESLPFYQQLALENVKALKEDSSFDEILEQMDIMCSRAKLISDQFLYYRIIPKKYIDRRPFENINKFVNIGIVIQGPIKYEDNFTYESILLYKRIYPNTLIILSTWEDEKNNKNFRQFENLAKEKGGIEILLSKKPQLLTEKGFSTLSLQLCSTYAGLLTLKEKGIEFALKIRSDARVNSIYFLDNCMRLIDQFKAIDTEKQKNRLVILPTPNRQLIGNVCDYLMFGNIEDMLIYWEYPIDYATECEKHYAIHEIMLNRKYLAYLNVKCKNVSDFEEVLKKYFIIIDIDDFNFYWDKYNFRGVQTRESYTAYDWIK